MVKVVYSRRSIDNRRCHQNIPFLTRSCTLLISLEMSASLFPSKLPNFQGWIRADKVVGNVPSGSKPRIIRDSHELETVSVGEVIAPLNDYCLLWDEVCHL